MIETLRRAGWRQAVWPAAALATGVVSWEQSLHAARGFETPGPVLPHLLIDGALAFPLAFAAILLASFVTPPRSLRRAFVCAAAFSAFLVPAVRVHHAVHALLGAHGRISPLLAHALHARGEPTTLAHGFSDAMWGMPVALTLACALLRVRVSLVRARRGAMVLVAVASVFSVLPARAAPVITPFSVPLVIPPVLTSSSITLTAAETDVPILPGAPTKMWTFNGSFPGPTIRRPSGQPTQVTVVNDLPAVDGSITIHQHGEHSTSADDGQPDNHLIAPGDSHTYSYDLMEGGAPERGAFQWYHDHAMDVTGHNVWMGLAGMTILDDPTEAAINTALPNGARDVPLMILDRTFDDNNQIPYTFNAEGNQGSVILVNGTPQPYFEVADVQYRLRILNASNARSYDFKLSDGQQMTQIATESGLLPVPVQRTDILLGPAERAEVIVDFRKDFGKNITLQNTIGFTPNLSQAMQFRVVRHEADTSTIPGTLRAAPVFDPTSIAATRLWVFGRDTQSGVWTINGNGFDANRIDAMPKLGTTERWIFVNSTDVDHIVHIHDVDWEITSRAGGPDPTQTGPLLGEAGLRESFRLRPQEIVTVVSRFTDHTGIFVLHCHILEHEDQSMMTQFEVVP